MKKKISCTFFILVIGVLIVPLFFSTPVLAEITGTTVGYYNRVVSWEELEQTTTRNYKYTGGVVIVTNDPNAYGEIQIGTIKYHYSGKYTYIPITGTTTSLSSIPTNVSGTFDPNVTGMDVVQLNPVQLQALLDVIRDNAGSDLSTIETTLDLIKTTLISINVNTENNDGESYLRLIDELLQDKLPRYQTLLTNIQNTDNNIYSQLSNIRSTLNTISIYVNQLNNKFPSDYGNSVLTKLDTLNTTCNAIITAIDTDFQHLEDNIDNLIDTITWINDNNTNTSYSIDGTEYLTDNINNAKIKYLRFNNLSFISDKLYYIELPIALWQSSATYNDLDLNFYSTISGRLIPIEADYYYYTYQYRIRLFIHPNNMMNSPLLTIEFPTQIINENGTKLNLSYSYNSSITNIKFISNTDIEFWHLLYYIKSFRFHDQMTKELETTDNLNNINSQLQQNSQQMFNQEEEFNNNLNSSLGNITLPDNPFNNFGTMFGQSSRFLVYMFDQMTTTRGSPFGTVITFSLLLGLALLMIGKKGR